MQYGLVDSRTSKTSHVYTPCRFIWNLWYHQAANLFSVHSFWSVNIVVFFCHSIEVNECADNPQVCKSNRICENTYASYRCNCPGQQNLVDDVCRGKDYFLFIKRFVFFCSKNRLVFVFMGRFCPVATQENKC